MEEIIKAIKEHNIISKDGIKVNGIGILINKLDKLAELQDKTNFKLYYVEEKLKKLIELTERKA